MDHLIRTRIVAEKISKEATLADCQRILSEIKVVLSSSSAISEPGISLYEVAEDISILNHVIEELDRNVFHAKVKLSIDFHGDYSNINFLNMSQNIDGMGFLAHSFINARFSNEEDAYKALRVLNKAISLGNNES